MHSVAITTHNSVSTHHHNMIHPAKLLTTLHNLCTTESKLLLVNDKNNDIAYHDLKSATHIRLNDFEHLVPLDIQLPIQISKGVVTLRSFLYLWISATSSFGEYFMNAVSRGGDGTMTATIAERIELLDWLRGLRTHCSLINQPIGDDNSLINPNTNDVIDDGDPVFNRRVDALNYAVAPGSSLAGPAVHPKSNIPIHFDHLNDPSIPRVCEYTLRTRSSYLTPPGNKDFRYVTKLAFEPLIKGVTISAKNAGTVSNVDTRRKHQSKSSQASQMQTQPIIIVPPGFNALLSIYNVKPFLEEAKYIPTTEARELIRGYGSKPSSLEVVRKQTGILSSSFSKTGMKQPVWKVMVCDSAERLVPADWDRVIAVFASGAMWQFSGWRWSHPVDLFSNVRGYHIRFHDDDIGSAISQWNVKHLVLHRTKRHLDLPLVLDFWTDLEKWVATHKPHLFA